LFSSLPFQGVMTNAASTNLAIYPEMWIMMNMLQMSVIVKVCSQLFTNFVITF
jgi:hypothetical protein